LERVSQQIDERQFQIFDLYVTKDWPAGRVAKMLGVSVARVYLTKHRVAALCQFAGKSSQEFAGENHPPLR
jgi:RNA polymerase sigma-70 factor (ECF subfamily)